MFSGILTIRNDEEWMRTRKATLALEELIKTMGDAFREKYSPRAPVELTYIVVSGYPLPVNLPLSLKWIFFCAADHKIRRWKASLFSIQQEKSQQFSEKD